MLSKTFSKKFGGGSFLLFIGLGLTTGALIMIKLNSKPVDNITSKEKVVVYLSLKDKEIRIGQETQAEIFFNTGNASVSEVNLRFSYPYSGNFPEVEVSQIEVNPLLASKGWSCPVQTASPTGGSMEIDIACLNQGDDNQPNNSDILLATFNPLARQVPEVNPFGITFDSNSSRAISLSNNQTLPLLNVNPVYVSVARPSGAESQEMAKPVSQTTDQTKDLSEPESLLGHLMEEGQVLASTSTPSATPTISPTPTTSYWSNTTPTPTASAAGSGELLESGWPIPLLVSLPLGLIMVIFAGLILI